MSEIRDQRSDVRGQMSEARDQMSDVSSEVEVDVSVAQYRQVPALTSDI